MMKHSLGGKQHQGLRPNQEDCLGGVAGSIYCLCDGMGGHSDGEKASKLVTFAFLWEDYEQVLAGKSEGRPRMASASAANIREQLLQSLDIANNALRNAKQNGRIGADAGCTLVAVCFCAGRAYFLSVGDSLIFVQRNRRVECINQSCLDTKWNELVRAGMSEEEARRQPKSHGLVQAVVGRDIRNPHFFPKDGFLLQPGDRIILASDGIQPIASEDDLSELTELLCSHPVPSIHADDDTSNSITQRVADHIVEAVLKTNTRNQDNVSVFVIDFPSPDGCEVAPTMNRQFPSPADGGKTKISRRGRSISMAAPAPGGRKNYLLIPILLIFTLLAAGIGITMWNMKVETAEAIEKQKQAEAERQKAEAHAKAAEDAKNAAEKEKNAAVAEKQQAEEAQKNAITSASRAERDKLQAEEARKKAEEAAAKAEEEKAAAVEAATKAEEEKAAAEEAAAKAEEEKAAAVEAAAKAEEEKAAAIAAAKKAEEEAKNAKAENNDAKPEDNIDQNAEDPSAEEVINESNSQNKVEEATIKAEEATKKVEEAGKKAEDAKKAAEDAAKKAEEARKKAEEAAAKAEEEKAAAVEAAKKAEAEKAKAEEEARKIAEAEKAKAEEEARRRAEEAKRKAEEEARRRAEEAKRKAEEEEARRKENEKKDTESIFGKDYKFPQSLPKPEDGNAPDKDPSFGRDDEKQNNNNDDIVNIIRSQKNKYNNEKKRLKATKEELLKALEAKNSSEKNSFELNALNKIIRALTSNSSKSDEAFECAIRMELLLEAYPDKKLLMRYPSNDDFRDFDNLTKKAQDLMSNEQARQKLSVAELLLLCFADVELEKSAWNSILNKIKADDEAEFPLLKKKVVPRIQRELK